MLKFSSRRLNMGLGDAYVKKVFDTVSSKYDFMNDVLSLGIHRSWKNHFVENSVRPVSGAKFLDIAGGTGDIAFRITDAIRRQEHLSGLTPKILEGTKVVVCDINQKMLDEGQSRAARGGYFDIEWVCASGEELPFEDEVYDHCTISFGIRNFSDRPKALREAFRILKVGGVLNILEFSHVTFTPLKIPYSFWLSGFLPQAGRMLADEESYRYLAESIRAFPDQETFAKMIQDAGFSFVRYENLSGGIACIHTAVKTNVLTPKTENTSHVSKDQQGDISTPDAEPKIT
ncbi:unnamed protein product [Phytomonas sp. EM1]|nr:unnamed protein product [Phytomonas sp. EM1]|eukprot:CCW63335.1 unnamed protein product [Phytomonas sp. isolate EM1]